MNSRERVKVLIRHEEVDRVPHGIAFTKEGAQVPALIEVAREAVR
jgi:hypothetical protein